MYWSCDSNNNSVVASKSFIMWWPGTGLNRRRRPFQGRALPLSYLASVADFKLQFPVRDAGGTGSEGGSTDSALQQLCQYINSVPGAPNSPLQVSGSRPSNPSASSK